MNPTNSKVIEIRRHMNFYHEAKKEAQEYFKEAIKSIGSYWAPIGKKVASGLTYEEERLLMPSLVNCEPTDRDFRKKVEDYFVDIHTRVPHTGIKLETGLEDNSLKLGEKNMPLNIEDYVAFRHALGHPHVAKNEQEAKSDGSKQKQFFVYDENEITNKDLDLTALKDKAIEFYLTVKDKPEDVDMYLVLLGEFLNKISEKERSSKLRKLADTKPKEVIDVFEDKETKAKYFIEQCIRGKILERIGTRILIQESGQEIGRDIKEAVLFLKDEANSKDKASLKAKLQTFQGR